MKFKLEPKPAINSVRVIEKFAYIPIWIGDEVRWFEKVKIRQKYFLLPKRLTIGRWQSLEFVQ